MKSRLEELYRSTICPALVKDLKLKNVMQAPVITKIVVNIGLKDAVTDSKVIDATKDILEKITCQAAVKTSARKSIAGFKLRQGVPIGLKVTLRKSKMYHFLDKIINVVLPSVRDFQGVGIKFDGTGNYNLGLKDWMVFPEVDYDKVDKSRGMNITIHTTAMSDDHAHVLLSKFNVPFKRTER
ncbi:MAG: 50S ribosomal protein L5 [Epsilonproteobacteria bacterium]|nr:50S ribosomal protein L5 [Campylobacterota bacterium]